VPVRPNDSQYQFSCLNRIESNQIKSNQIESLGSQKQQTYRL
jgi:hypothetical protein